MEQSGEVSSKSNARSRALVQSVGRMQLILPAAICPRHSWYARGVWCYEVLVPGADVLCGVLYQVLAAVVPKRGRMLVFPHKCPHAGGVVLDPPKLLLRGELY